MLFIVFLAVASAKPEYCGGNDDLAEVLSSRGEPPSEDSLKLVQVQVVTRHGARTPATSCGPYLPAAALLKWDCGAKFTESVGSVKFLRSFNEGALGTCEVGQILSEGLQQMHGLGVLLGGYHLPEPELYVRSSDLSRTRASAEALVSGFLGASDTIVDLDTMDFAEDWIYPNEAKCPNLQRLRLRAYSDKAFVKWNATTRAELEPKLTTAFPDGWSFGDDMAGSHLLDCILSALCVDKGPIFASDSKPDDLVDAMTTYAEKKEFHKLTFEDRAYSKLVALPLVQRILAKARSSVGFAVWSGHDTTVMPLKVALGIEDNHWAPYGDAVVFEVWQSDSRRYVRVVTRRGPSTLLGCATDLCPLEDIDATVATWNVSCTPPPEDLHQKKRLRAQKQGLWPLQQQASSPGPPVGRVLLACLTSAIQIAIGVAIGLRFAALATAAAATFVDRSRHPPLLFMRHQPRAAIPPRGTF